ncbi:hypothetical protein ACFFX1_14925 [Dactylosporangium sucinum]|uniref:hypothetical protein n=1 Tax=Dactylosporangium sucinum TaxID=1424081 RepID=UPI00167D9C88|nr:hypothetical protein [Dactylosporangium sucinum]
MEQKPAPKPRQTAQAPDQELVTWEDVPMPHLKVPVVHMGSGARMGSAVERVRAAVEPRPGRLLYYGGVGALAVLGVLEWPVALAAAAGVWVATHERRRTATSG